MKGMNILPGTLFLAPMAETSTPALRRIVKEFCPGAVLYSEMLSAGAIAAGSPHNGPLVCLHEFDEPLIYQIVGADPAVMAEACAILSGNRCFGIDINMGCPNHEIVKKGQGARLLTDIEKAREIVRACRRATRVKLSVKMRTGYEESDEGRFIDFIRMLEGEGVDFIAVHPRSARLGFRRTADWRFVAMAKRHVSIPVIGNGDIDTPGKAAQRMRESGCDGVMIGREAVKSPWIFRLSSDLISGRPAALDVDLHEVFISVLDYLKLYLPVRLHKSRGHRFCVYFAQNLKYGHELFTRIRKESDIDAMREYVEDYFMRNPDETIKHCFTDGGWTGGGTLTTHKGAAHGIHENLDGG
jgi:tRNA-dihydrouridine synthase B